MLDYTVRVGIDRPVGIRLRVTSSGEVLRRIRLDGETALNGQEKVYLWGAPI